jgi:hypothetical protein
MKAPSPALACRGPFLALAGLLIVALVCFWLLAHRVPPGPADERAEPSDQWVGPPGPIGVWVQPPYKLEELSGRRAPRSGFWDFLWPDPEPPTVIVGILPTVDRTLRYDGETVYLKLFSPDAPEDRPEDLVFRLQAEWRDDALYALLPSGRWKQVATFGDGHFQIVNEFGMREVLQKADPSKEYLKRFLKDRPVCHPPPSPGQGPAPGS